MISRCRCERCDPGDPAPTYTQRYRHHCEVMHIIGLPTRTSRTEYLDAVRQKRGRAAAEQLRQSVVAAWEAGIRAPSPRENKRALCAEV